MDQWIKLRRKIHNKDQEVSLRQLERTLAFTGKRYAKSGTTVNRQAISELNPSKKPR